MLNLSSLNPQQRQAVETVNGPVLILAGAGTGKTRVITFRIAHMITRGIAPDNILGVTFTNKAAREMQERVRKLIPKPAARPSENGGRPTTPKPTLCTFHSLCVRILRVHIEKLGYKKSFVIYDETEQVGAIKKILSQLSAKSLKIEPSQVLGMISRVKNSGERTAALADPDLYALSQHLRPRYESALRACNAVDFDDLILLTLRLFKEHPDALENCRAKYRYVMVDEYQDTNAAQFQLVHALTSEHRNLCVVGDDDQSIYGWRGAEIANLLDMEKYFPEVKVIKLEQNYRSTNNILNAANALIKNNALRRGKQLWSQNGDGTRLTLRCYDDDEAEAKGVVEAIEYARLAHRVPWSEQAILFRTNAQSRPMETALRQAGVRYHLIGGQSFFDRREIRDFVAYLKTFINPHDDISLLRIANVPARGLTDVTMERLLAASHERKCSVYAAMKNPAVTTTFQARTRESIEAFVAFIEKTRAFFIQNALHREPRLVQDWADSFLRETGYLEDLRRLEKTVDAADSRVRNVLEMAAELDGDDPSLAPQDRLHHYLEDLSLDSDRSEQKEIEGDAVTLITMHSCKGLEYPHVYIVGLERGLLPHARALQDGTLDEERRLFYVALTRAMKTLSLSHCNTRKKYGKLTPCHPSGFLKELPSELLEDGDATAKAPVKPAAGKSMFDAMRALCD